MGFRDFVCFNQSLLAKQSWRLLTNPNSLAFQIYKQKYFPSSNFLQAKWGNNASSVWRSLLWGRELLVKGIRWRIGSGTRVKVFQDPWLLRSHSFKPITIPSQDHLHLMVPDLMQESGKWDWTKVNNFLWEVDSFARKVRKMLELWPHLIGFHGRGFKDLFQWMVDNGRGEDLANFVLVCWSLWTERNLLVFQNKVKDREDVLTRARRTKEHCRIFSEIRFHVGIQTSTQSFWQPPITGAFKVNVDTAVAESLNNFGVGIVGRDNNGYLIFAEGWNFQGSLCVRTADLLAIEESY
ncbi:uncharacterized protein LOC142554340 [Primulina tabacum]|uniref:uncharacterized protein LOC142554340 n=1 Tax=Primulina tabacum TaxID=48773 RepID=UPI003F596A4D